MGILGPISIAFAIIVFLIYAGLAIYHALKFKHISKRTLYLTYFFAGTSAFLLLMIILGTISIDWA